MRGWQEFAQDMRQFYSVDMSCLSSHYRMEQEEYYAQTSAWTDVHPAQMLGSPTCFKKYDLLTGKQTGYWPPVCKGALGARVLPWCSVWIKSVVTRLRLLVHKPLRHVYPQRYPYSFLFETACCFVLVGVLT